MKDLIKRDEDCSYDAYYYSNFESYTEMSNNKVLKIIVDVNSYDDETNVSKLEIEKSNIDFGQIVIDYIKDGIEKVLKYGDKTIHIEDIEIYKNKRESTIDISFGNLTENQSGDYASINIAINKELFEKNMIDGLTKYSFDAKRYSDNKVECGTQIEYKGKIYFFRHKEVEIWYCSLIANWMF